MYNRYVGRGFDDLLPPEAFESAEIDAQVFEDVERTPMQQRPPSSSANPLSSFFGSLKLPELSADTLILLVLVYFLVYEEGESVGDTMLLIGVLLILGF